MQRLVCLFMVTLSGWQQPGSVSSASTQWPRFRDEAHRLSFAHPPDLRPVVSPAEQLRGVGGWVSRVLLVADPRDRNELPVLSVSVYVCDDPALDPRVPCVDDQTYRKMCDRFEKFPLGDATAIQCVTYGRGACHWSAIVVREKGTVEISTPAAGREANEKTTDRAACADAVAAIRKQPLLRQVLASFRFQQPD